MTPAISQPRDDASPATAAWSPVYALAFCTFVLVASEFMPVSLLSPIAAGLGLTEGRAGQAISISGVFAVVTSLFITSLAGRLDRRIVLIALAAMLGVSGILVGLAPTFLILMIGRALLGVAIGGFWSMSAATTMRLVPQASVGRALAIVYGGAAVASTVSAPLGSLMGGLIGWRGAFLAVVPLAVIATVWLAMTLPTLLADERDDKRGPFRLLGDRRVATGMMAVLLLFMGQFALYTYLRPFLEQVTGVGLPMLSILLLVIGVAGLAGTAAVGRLLDYNLPLTLVVFPAVMAATAIGLVLLGQSVWATAGLLAIWGFASTAAPVGWFTWMTRTIPDDAEAGGGLMVAVIQFAITLGATAGGIVFDSAGPASDFTGSAAILGAAALAAVFSGSAGRLIASVSRDAI